MNKRKFLILSFLGFIASSAIQAEVKQVARHTHDGRSHIHVLPKSGLKHQHGSGTSAATSKTPSTPKQPIKNHSKTPVTQCDLLAANPLDPDRVTKGVNYSDIQTMPALGACSRATKQYPNTGRLMFQYALALFKARYPREAVIWFKKGIQAGHAYSANWLGESTMLGHTGIPKDLSKAESILKQGLKIKPNDPEMLEFLGRTYLLQGRYKQAFAPLINSAKIGHADSMFWLSRYYVATDNIQKSKYWENMATKNGSNQSSEYWANYWLRPRFPASGSDCNAAPSSNVNSPCYSAAQHGYERQLEERLNR